METPGCQGQSLNGRGNPFSENCRASCRGEHCVALARPTDSSQGRLVLSKNGTNSTTMSCNLKLLRQAGKLAPTFQNQPVSGGISRTEGSGKIISKKRKKHLHFPKSCATILRHLRVYAPVAQLDRVTDYESVGRGFESLPAYHERSLFCLPDKGGFFRTKCALAGTRSCWRSEAVLRTVKLLRQWVAHLTSHCAKHNTSLLHLPQASFTTLDFTLLP